MGNTISSFDHEQQLLHYDGYKYCEPIGDPDQELNLSPIYRSTLSEGTCKGFPTNNPDQPLTTSMYELFEIGLQLNGLDAQFMGQRTYRLDEATASGYAERKDGSIDRFEYEWINFGESKTAIHAFGRGLMALGLKAGDHFGVLSSNRPEWTIAEFALYLFSLTCVPLYTSLGKDIIEFIVKHAEISAVLVSPQHMNTLIKSLPKLQKSTLKHVIFIDSLFDNRWGNSQDKLTDEMVSTFTSAGLKLTTMSAIIELGNSDEHKNYNTNPSKGDTTAFLLYSSGTTGTPKGIPITNTNITCTLGAQASVLQQHFKPQDTYFSYLPLGHIFEVGLSAGAIAFGGRIAYSQDNIRQIVSDLVTTKPALIGGVPKIWSKFHDEVWAKVDAMGTLSFKRWYIYRAYNYQLSQLRHGLPLDETYDQRVFQQMREKLGLNKIKCILTGGAPCPPYLVEFIRVLTNAWLSQCYGLTESCGATFISLPQDYTIGSNGGPNNHCEFRLRSLQDMGYDYTQDNPTGELLLGGPSIFHGYYKNDEANESSFITDSNGKRWFVTGDIVRVNPLSGSVSVIDRKKALLKLAQGEYVSLEKVQSTYQESPLVAHIWAYGNAYKSYMTGVVVPNIGSLYDHFATNHWWPSSVPKPHSRELTDQQIETITQITDTHRDKITTWIKDSLSQYDKDLNGYEKLKAIYVDTNYDKSGQVWNESNGLITASQKLKVKPLSEHYLPQLKEMYTKLGQPPRSGEPWY